MIDAPEIVQTAARLLGIDRRTLYRWLGEREEPSEGDEG